MFYLQQSIGIEFREHTLKAIHLAKTLNGFKVLNYLQAPLPAGDIFTPGYQEAVVTQLKGFIQQYKIKADEAVIGLPPSEVALRQIEVPLVEPAELPQMLEYEMERHLPFASHEVYLDFIILNKGEQLQNLLLLAVQKNRVDQYLALLHQARLKCMAVDITPLAVVNLLQLSGVTGNGGNALGPRDYLLAEVGTEAVELSLIKSGKLVMARRRSLGELGFLAQPESPNPQIETSTALSLEDQAGKLAQRISGEIDYWQKSLPYDTGNPQSVNPQSGNPQTGKVWAEHIFVLTSGEMGELICQKLEEQTQIHASAPNNWPVIKPGMDEDQRAIELAAGLGLALRGVTDYPEEINLLPPLQRQAKKKGKLAATIALPVLVALLGVANLVGFFLKGRLALARVEQQMELLEPKLAAINELEDQYKRLQLPVDTLRRVKPRAVTILDILKEITLKLPADAWLTKMKVEENTVEISGRATSASNLISLLEASDLFENVKFTSAITSREGQKEKFKIKMTLESKGSEESS